MIHKADGGQWAVCRNAVGEAWEAKLRVSQTESIALRKSFQKTDHRISLELRKCKFIDKVLFPEDKVYSGSCAGMMTSIISQDISWQEGSPGLGVRTEPLNLVIVPSRTITNLNATQIALIDVRAGSSKHWGHDLQMLASTCLQLSPPSYSPNCFASDTLY